MDAIAKSDLFFLITSVAVIVVSAILVVVLVYALRVLRDLRDIAGRAKREAELLSDDLAEIRMKMKTEAAGFRGALRAITGIFSRRKGRKERNS